MFLHKLQMVNETKKEVKQKNHKNYTKPLSYAISPDDKAFVYLPGF